MVSEGQLIQVMVAFTKDNSKMDNSTDISEYLINMVIINNLNMIMEIELEIFENFRIIIILFKFSFFNLSQYISF